MIVLYKGEKSCITTKFNMLFDRMVPTFVNKALFSAIENKQDFELYDPNKEYDRKVVGNKRIMVTMPTQLEWLVASIRVIDRIKESFPFHPIDVMCDERYRTVNLIKDVNFLEYYNPQTAKIYYRTINLNLKNNSQNITAVKTLFHSYEQLALQFAKLYDEITDGSLKPRWLHIPKLTTDTTPYIVLIKNGDDDTCTFPELGDFLEENLTEFDVRVIEKYDINQLKNQINLINNAKFLLSCGDTAALILGCSLHIETFAFMPNLPIKRERQFDRYSNFKFTYIDPELTADRILPKIKSMINEVLDKYGTGKENISIETDDKRSKRKVRGKGQT